MVTDSKLMVKHFLEKLCDRISVVQAIWTITYLRGNFGMDVCLLTVL